MAPPAVESDYKDLLNPIKDPEKSFEVNISQLLEAFLADFHSGNSRSTFNSAALVIQGSASVYGKKVEYLYNLATQFHRNLIKQNKVDPQQVRKETKEKEKKEEKSDNPFLRDDFRISKNLNCLKKKNAPKASVQKSQKSGNAPSITVHFISNDIEEKGEVFYDTRGELVGNKGDFPINKCRLINSGWLLLPTVNPKLVPSVTASVDYYDDVDVGEPGEISLDDIDTADIIANDDQSSPDEGFGSCPPSDDAVTSTPEAEVNSENNTESPMQSDNTAPPSVDEGVAATPENVEMEDTPHAAEGNENIPADNEEQGTAPKPIRRSLRERAPLKTVQLPLDNDPLGGLNIGNELLVRKGIQKKNCVTLPKVLKRSGRVIEDDNDSVSCFCARTLFAIDDKSLSKSLFRFDSRCFEKNTQFVERMLKKLAALKSSDKSKKIDPIEEDQEINVEDVECLQEEEEGDDNLYGPLVDDNDIHIDHDHDELPIIPEPPPICAEVNDGISPELPAADLAAAPSPDVSQLAVEYERHVIELEQLAQNSELTKRIQEWQNSVKPFMDLMEQRKSFDIYLYGRQILDSFEDNNRKQTKTFREICKFKEKYEIIRYFMALLPLINDGNVSIKAEEKKEKSDEIFITLMSRKMHQKNLEKFGHNDGSHS